MSQDPTTLPPVPQTEPTRKQPLRGTITSPAKAPQAAQEAPAAPPLREAVPLAPREAGAILAPSSLMPDLSDARPGAGEESSWWYWTGCLPGSPVQWCDFGGVGFPMSNETIEKLPDGNQRRHMVHGSLVKLSKAQLAVMVQRISRTVIRFEETPEQREEPGTGINISKKDPHSRPRRGYLITIPSKADMEAREKAGAPIPTYIASTRDEPVARYIYCVLVDQREPARGGVRPPSLAQAGLELPPGITLS